MGGIVLQQNSGLLRSMQIHFCQLLLEVQTFGITLFADQTLLHI